MSKLLGWDQLTPPAAPEVRGTVKRWVTLIGSDEVVEAEIDYQTALTADEADAVEILAIRLIGLLEPDVEADLRGACYADAESRFEATRHSGR